MNETSLDVAFCRQFFPPLANGWVYLENAGGSYAPRQVLDAMRTFMEDSQCQPEWAFDPAKRGKAAIVRAQRGLAGAIGADADEIIIGPSTTLNVYVLSHALEPLLASGDTIVVTNQDHEANGGAWRRLSERRRLTLREWRIDPLSGDLDPDALDPLLAGGAKLVCFPHVSNVVGSVNDVAAITARAHAAGAMVCVDGVAAVAHGLPDVRALGVDFYLFSLYKLYGPHLALLYGKRERIAACANQNHFFHEGHPPATLNPGGLNYESVASASGIVDYLEAVYTHHFGDRDNHLRARMEKVFALFARHEAALTERLLEALRAIPGLRLIGRDESDPRRRAPTVSFTVAGHRAQAIAEALAAHRICAGHGHFYGYRTVQGLGIDPDDGVVRLSMVHYNTRDEIERAAAALAAVLAA